jgi:hypothetical protein
LRKEEIPFHSAVIIAALFYLLVANNHLIVHGPILKMRAALASFRNLLEMQVFSTTLYITKSEIPSMRLTKLYINEYYNLRTLK